MCKLRYRDTSHVSDNYLRHRLTDTSTGIMLNELL
ncbi:hypothetical protein SAMN05444157_0231 [Frankineae bacterium MT45]|nr:hypothetical protein SAMN05444157_0231 [Frankineae bacterium MT45]